jgi:hypothetical protein
MARKKRDPVERLFSKVKVLENGCWEYTGKIADNGYGHFYLEGQLIGAHVASFRLCKGPIPEGHVIRHTCDYRPCINPAHLMPGTQKQNCEDAVVKDRHSRGSRNGLAKITEEQALQIRGRLDEGDTALSKEFGLSRAAIWFIRKDLHWKHV